jgi:hypothetical protein
LDHRFVLAWIRDGTRASKVLIDGGLDGQTIRFEGNIGGGGIILGHAGPE